MVSVPAAPLALAFMHVAVARRWVPAVAGGTSHWPVWKVTGAGGMVVIESGRSAYTSMTSRRVISLAAKLPTRPLTGTRARAVGQQHQMLSLGEDRPRRGGRPVIGAVQPTPVPGVGVDETGEADAFDAAGWAGDRSGRQGLLVGVVGVDVAVRVDREAGGRVRAAPSSRRATPGPARGRSGSLGTPVRWGVVPAGW